VTNGRVEIGNDTKTETIGTVNGSISVDGYLTVDGDIESVNGAVSLRDGGNVSGTIETVNGLIYLNNVTVENHVGNINGGMHFENGTTINGNVKVEKPENGWNANQDPLIIIGKNVEIKGDLLIEPEVRLYVHKSASIGSIKGAKAEYYDSNDAPEEH